MKQLVLARTIVSLYGAVAATPHAGVKVVSNVSVFRDSKEAIGNAILLLLRSGLYSDLAPDLRRGFVDLSIYQPGIGGEAVYFAESEEMAGADGDRSDALVEQSAAAIAWWKVRLSEAQERERQIVEADRDGPTRAAFSRKEDSHQ
jgi:hypothetical protein